jgi:hypothetical protein
VRMEKTWKSVGLLQLGTVLPMLLLVNVGPVVARQVTGTSGLPSATTTIDGKQIPPPPPKFGGVIKESAKDSTSWWPPSVVPPKGAPNVLLVMTDDRQALGAHTMSQNHFTLGSPLETPADAKLIAEQLPPLMPTMFNAEDSLGTIHYSRFTVLSDKKLLFLGDFDGEFSQLIADLAKHAGPVFDAIFQHAVDPPSPVADHADAFVEWTAEHLVPAVNLYTAYPGVTTKEIKALAAAAGVEGVGELHPFLVILPMKSKLVSIEVQLILRARESGTTKDLDKVGTPHFAQFVLLEDNQIGFFTVYDGSFDKCIADFTKNIGPIFDVLLKFTKGVPPSPCRKYLQEFIDFAAGANRTPIGFYQAYPGLSVQDIHALIADRKAESATA